MRERERDKEKVLDAIHKYKRFQQNVASSLKDDAILRIGYTNKSIVD